MDLVSRDFLCFNGDKLYFDVDEDDLLDEEEDVYMVDTISSL